MLYLTLGAFAGALISRLIRPKVLLSYSESPRSKIVVSTLVLVLVALLIFGAIEFINGASGLNKYLDYFADRFLKFLIGLGVGFLIGSWIYSRNMTITFVHLGILVVMIVIALGPHYWSNWLQELGIKRIGTVEFESNNINNIANFNAQSTVVGEKIDSDILSILHIVNMPFLIERDIKLIGLFTKNNESIEHSKNFSSSTVEKDSKKIKDVVNALLIPILTCVQEIKSKSQYSAIDTSDAVTPVALSFSEILNLLQIGKIDEETALKFKLKLEDAMTELEEKLQKLTTQPKEEKTKEEKTKVCQLTDISDISDTEFTTKLNYLVGKLSYPYLTIARVNLLLQVEGQTRESRIHILNEELKAWIEGLNVSSNSKFSNVVRMIYLVRAYSTLDSLADKYWTGEVFQIKLDYLDALTSLLHEAKKLNILGDEHPLCGKWSDKSQIQDLVTIEILTKNNFADDAGNQLRTEFQSKALKFADETSSYPVEQCLGRRLGSFSKFLRATFLDTYASTNVSFSYYEYRNQQLNENKFIVKLNYFVGVWSEALKILHQAEKQADNNGDTQVLSKIDELHEKIVASISNASTWLVGK